MKKYYMIRLYQVSPDKGYLKTGDKHPQMVIQKTSRADYKLEEKPIIVDTQKIIMVEKYGPYLVKEVKTGIIFPIVDFSKKNPFDKVDYISSPNGKAHTFVKSRDNKLLAKEVKSSEDLDDYNMLYPNPEILKTELLKILGIGKSNKDIKIKSEDNAKTLSYEQKPLKRKK